MNNNSKKLVTLAAGLGAVATLTGVGAGSAAAAPGGVADGCYEVISPVSALPGSGLGTKLGTAYVKGGKITALGQRGTVTATPTGGRVQIAGLTARLKPTRLGGEVVGYTVHGIPGVRAMLATC